MPYAILDHSGRVVGMLAGRPPRPPPGVRDTWDDAVADVTEAIHKARKQFSFAADDLAHRRGDFPARLFGVSHGGGQTHPCIAKQSSPENAAILDGLRLNPSLIRIAGYGSSAFAFYAPKLWRALCNQSRVPLPHDGTLRWNFNSSIFPCATINFGPQSICFDHIDNGNAAAGWCDIVGFGNYDPQKGGHLVLFDIKKIIVFPPGSHILIPSSIMRHGNTPVADNETRVGFTQYAAGGLFRWVENGFQTVDGYTKANPKLRQKLDAAAPTRFATLLKLYSKVDDLIADRMEVFGGGGIAVPTNTNHTILRNPEQTTIRRELQKMPWSKEKQRRRQRRIDKKARKTARLWAEGVRETVLAPHIAPYADALSRSWVHERDYLAKVQNHYHAVIPWRLPDDEEPPLPLPEYNPSLLTPRENLTEEEQQLKSQTIGRRNKKTNMDPEHNPFAALLTQLTGLAKPPQRARQGWQQFMHERNDDVIGPAVSAAWQKKIADGLEDEDANNVSFRAEIARKLFKELSVEEQAVYMDNAKKAKEVAMADYKQAVARALSKESRSPALRQQCLDNVASFMGPIMQGLRDMTGYHWLLIGGGPTPRLEGEIGTVHLHAGLNLANVPMHWRQWDETRFDSGVVAFFKEYLNTCFTPEDCTAAALPSASLDGASYTIPHDPAGIRSERDSDSDSSDGSDSDSSSDTSRSSIDSDLPSPAKATSKKKKKAKANKENDAKAAPGKRKRAGSGAMTAKKKQKHPAAPSLSTPLPAQAAPPPTPLPSQALPSPAAPPPTPLPSEPAGNTSVLSTEKAPRGSRLSEHELIRNQSLARNKKMLEELGLPTQLEDMQLGLVAPQPSRPKPKPKKKIAPAAPQRKSARKSSGQLSSKDTRGSLQDEGGELGDRQEADGDVLMGERRDNGLLQAATVSGDESLSPIANPLDFRPSAPATPSSLHASPSALPRPVSPVAALPSAVPSTDAPPMAVAIPPTPAAALLTTTTATEASAASPPPRASSSAVPLQDSTVPFVAAASTPPLAAHPATGQALAKRYIPPTSVKSSWLGAPLLEITAHNLGAGYSQALDLLCKLEIVYGLKSSTASFQSPRGKKVPLPPKPAVLHTWVKDGRGRLLKPEVTDAAIMSKSWWKYWLALQPSWRGTAIPLSIVPVDELPHDRSHWGSLVLPGINGMLGIVACLYWWGCTATGITLKDVNDRGSLEDWEAAVSDVTYVLQGLLRVAQKV
ncbi:hypothetical protein HWV62_23825 [Athelia sp. TMB]|nr:hypothetical protein HWV62_23825 [Athelia sp. TMB]